MTNKNFVSLAFIYSILFLIVFSCDKSEEVKLSIPELGTVIVSSIEAKSAMITSSMISDGNSEIEEYGFVWNTNPDPSINNSIYKDSVTFASSFSTTITDLLPLKTYYIRAYAKNSVGISYSDEVEFETTHYTYEGHIKLTSQSEVEAFGENGFTIINGTLFIGQTRTPSNISSLSSLSSLNGIDQALYVEGYNQITDLSGLENLTSLGAIFIQDSELTNIDELINITSFTSTKISYIANNDNLLNLEGLSNIDSIASWFHLAGNPQLTDLDDLTNLKYVKKLIIENHSKLEDIDGLSKLNSVNQLEIINNPLITNLDGLININSIGTSCLINGNSALTDFCVFTTILTKDSDFTFSASGNSYNPTKQDLIDGTCSQ